MPWALIGAGIVLDLVGTIWMLQGLNVLGGSPMSGQSFWAGAGLAVVIAGLGLVVIGVRRLRALSDGKADR